MSFLVVSTGVNCAPWIEQCLDSVAQQGYPDFRMVIVDDASDDGKSQDYIEQFVARFGDRFFAVYNDKRMGAMYNQVQAIQLMEPDPEDILLWVDSDDRLAHQNVLERLMYHYADGTRMTYGQYRTEPYSATCEMPSPYPDDVIARNAFRKFILRGGGIRYNHLRTVKAELFYGCNDNDFKDREGNWFKTCADAAMMIPCMELANGRIKCLREVLYVYNSANPFSDWRRDPRQVDSDHLDILMKPRKN